MSSEWAKLKIQDIGDVKSGKRLPLGHSLVDVATPYPYIRLVDVSHGSVQGSDLQFLTAETRAVIKRYIVNTADVCLAIVGHTIGMVFYIDAEWNDVNLTENAARITDVHCSVNSRYLYYYLVSPVGQTEIISRKVGSAQGKLPLYNIKSLEVTVPPRKEQDEIVAILDVMSSRITLLRETNATLEAIAQALFKSWFVDFDPVRAKLEGRPPEGMDEATARLFPDSFEESELGLVPRGWRIGTLADLSDLNPESWTAKNHPDTVAYIDLANAKDNEIASVTEFAFDDAPSRARRVLRDGDTIVGTVRPGNRSFAFIHEPASNLTASTGFAVLRPSAVENTEFVYLAATQDSSIEHLAHVADGGAYPAVRPDVVSGLQIVVPDEHVLVAFHDVAASLLAKVSENQTQAQTLATLRDTLLPRLISGQLRLPEAQAAAEEAMA
jgi:type I restriction enzyme, S subunit